MKTNQRARKVWKTRAWAGMLAVLLLASVEFWMVCRFGHDCGGISSRSASDAPALSDMVAVR
jgi:hypothetical protein